MNAAPIVAARGVTRRFGGLVALDGVDLDVPAGIVQAIIGPNGSGKTTLLNALSGASHADSGSIRIDGAEIFRLKPHRIARLGLARTFQNIRIFGDLTVKENVMVAAACHARPSLFGIITANARAEEIRSRYRSARGGSAGDGRPVAARRRPGRRASVRAAAPAGNRPRAGVAAEGDAARRAGRRHEFDRGDGAAGDDRAS